MRRLCEASYVRPGAISSAGGVDHLRLRVWPRGRLLRPWS